MDVYYEPKCYEHWGVLDLLQGTEDKKKKKQTNAKDGAGPHSPKEPQYENCWKGGGRKPQRR